MQDLQSNAANLPVRASSSVSAATLAAAISSSGGSAVGEAPGLSPDPEGPLNSLAELQARMLRLRAAEM